MCSLLYDKIIKDMIISGGTDLYPRDIEEVLVKHPSVREVAVYGVSSEKKKSS
jgi:acyl-CoA synthetase (AMP-forming)/AMP-acid ligase II